MLERMDETTVLVEFAEDESVACAITPSPDARLT